MFGLVKCFVRIQLLQSRCAGGSVTMWRCCAEAGGRNIVQYSKLLQALVDAEALFDCLDNHKQCQMTASKWQLGSFVSDPAYRNRSSVSLRQQSVPACWCLHMLMW